MDWHGVPVNWHPHVEGKPLHALSIPEPLASAVLDCGRDVESRPWSTAPHLVDQARQLLYHPVLIHAAGRFDRHQVRWVYQHGGRQYWERDVEKSAVIGVATLAAVTPHSESPWYEPGQVALTLRHPVRFDVPIPVQGRRGLWIPDVLVQERARRQMQFQSRQAS